MPKNYDLNKRYFDELISKARNNEPYYDMFEPYTPNSVRDILEQATIQAAKVKSQSDIPYLFENAQEMAKTPIKIDPKLSSYGKINYYVDPKTGLALPEEKRIITLSDLNDLASGLHERVHENDIISRSNVPQPLELPEKDLLSNIKSELDINRPIKSAQDLKGLDEATQYFASHYKPEDEEKFAKLKQILNFERAVKGNPLKVVAPIMKAAGVAAIGASALGVGQKAMAGDVGGAALDTADTGSYFIPGVGEARMIGDSAMGELGSGELPPDIQQQKDRFNKTRQLLQNKE